MSLDPLMWQLGVQADFGVPSNDKGRHARERPLTCGCVSHAAASPSRALQARVPGTVHFQAAESGALLGRLSPRTAHGRQHRWGNRRSGTSTPPSRTPLPQPLSTALTPRNGSMCLQVSHTVHHFSFGEVRLAVARWAYRQS